MTQTIIILNLAEGSHKLVYLLQINLRTVFHLWVQPAPTWRDVDPMCGHTLDLLVYSVLFWFLAEEVRLCRNVHGCEMSAL